VGFVELGCRYCKLRCNILVAMRHNLVTSCFVSEVLVWCVCVCMCGIFMKVGGLMGFM
jgi:hypothetical protein